MANLEQTDIDFGSLVLETPLFSDELLTVAGAVTLKKGTILARSTATDKLVIFVKGGVTNGNGVPKAVLPEEYVAEGAGDLRVRAIVQGVVNKRRLVIHADGDDSNIDGAVKDQLRDYKITPVDVAQVDGASFTDEDS